MLVKFSGNVGTVLTPGIGEDIVNALLGKEDGHLTAYPAGLTTEDEDLHCWLLSRAMKNNEVE
jgi:hypothetical protein